MCFLVDLQDHINHKGGVVLLSRSEHLKMSPDCSFLKEHAHELAEASKLKATIKNLDKMAADGFYAKKRLIIEKVEVAVSESRQAAADAAATAAAAKEGQQQQFMQNMMQQQQQQQQFMQQLMQQMTGGAQQQQGGGGGS